MKVSLYVRQRGTREQKKHNPKKSYPLDGSIIWVLRYGKAWETLDVKNLSEATMLRMRRQIELDGGWRPTTKVKQPTVLMLDAAMDKYLAEIEKSRKPKTHDAYSVALRYFYECVGNKPMKDIDRGDLLRFAAFLRYEKGQAPRSAYNKFENVMTFLGKHDVTGKALKIASHDWPQYVEEEPEIYEQEILDRFFAACDEDERLLFEFILMTGMREQEAIYATDRCLDFSANTVSVRHNSNYGWTPKMYKERTIPVPAALMAKLKKILVGRGRGGLLFPTANNKPKYDFLDMAKRIAHRAGIPQEEVWLHKFRATFATRALWANVDLRTVQAWMGHTDLASTMRYLRPQRDAAMRDKVEAIWVSA
jgi:integrase/recombinase XerD